MKGALAWVASVVCAATALSAKPALAEERYAIVIGANRGEPDEAELRFAERDARRVADVLVRLGGVLPEDLLVLLTPDATAVKRALTAFAARLRKGPNGATLMVYYSGHADAETLHLSGARYPFSDFKAQVKALGADATVFLVDACRSGGILKKGGVPVPAFDFAVQDAVASEGVAVITSSAEDEDAQESDRLQGGVFTHHLLAGLIGAADASKDARVSLAEAYRYAYEQTVVATSTSLVAQHPTYAFDVRGHNEIVMTRLGGGADRGALKFSDAGRYLLLRGSEGDNVVAELVADSDTAIVLVPGSYLVRRREPSAIYERAITVKAGGTTTLEAAQLERVAFRSVVRKGGYGLSERRALSLGGDVELSGALFGDGAMWLGAVGLQLDWADIALRGRVRFGYAEPDALLAVRQYLVGVDLGIYHLFDLGPHGIGFGLRGGLDWLGQRFETTGRAPPVDQVVGRVAPVARFELALGGSVALTLDAGVEVYVLDVSRAHDVVLDVVTPRSTSSAVQARVVPTATLGISVSLW